MKPTNLFTHNKAPSLPTIPEKEVYQRRTMSYGWHVSARAIAGKDMRRIPTFEQIRKEKVLEGLKQVEAAETLIKMKGSKDDT